MMEIVGTCAPPDLMRKFYFLTPETLALSNFKHEIDELKLKSSFPQEQIDDIEVGATKFVTDLTTIIAEQFSSLFSVKRIIKVGSFYERTKIGNPNEFDMLVQLDLDMEVEGGCDTNPCSVHVKTRQPKWLSTELANRLLCEQHAVQEDLRAYEGLHDEDGNILPNSIYHIYRHLVREVLGIPYVTQKTSDLMIAEQLQPMGLKSTGVLCRALEAGECLPGIRCTTGMRCVPGLHCITGGLDCKTTHAKMEEVICKTGKLTIKRGGPLGFAPNIVIVLEWWPNDKKYMYSRAHTISIDIVLCLPCSKQVLNKWNGYLRYVNTDVELSDIPAPILVIPSHKKQYLCKQTKTKKKGYLDVQPDHAYWSISFAPAEVHLMKQLSKKHNLLYRTLKFECTELIEDSGITSFMLKNAMLHHQESCKIQDESDMASSEEITLLYSRIPCDNKDKTMDECTKSVVEYLRACADVKFLPAFFFPKRNLWELGDFVNNEHAAVEPPYYENMSIQYTAIFQ